MPGKRLFHYTDEKSNKFWSISIDGNSHTVHFGRIGTKGQEQTKEFPSGEEAEKSYEKLIREKLNKGYIEIIDKKGSPSPVKNKEEYKKTLLNNLKEKDYTIRAKSAYNLRKKQYESEEVIEALIFSLKDETPQVRYNSAFSLGLLCNEYKNPNITDKAISSLRELRKDETLYVRTIAEEALRKIGDKEFIKSITDRAIDKLPLPLGELIKEERTDFPVQFEYFFKKEPEGTFLEALYEIDSPISREALKNVILTLDICRYWNYVKSIYKRVEYRNDMELFGLLAYKIETARPSNIISYIGSWFQINDYNMTRLYSIINNDKKMETLKSLKGYKLFPRDEFTHILNKEGFNKDEIQDILVATNYYSPLLKINDKTIKSFFKKEEPGIKLNKISIAGIVDFISKELLPSKEYKGKNTIQDNKKELLLSLKDREMTREEITDRLEKGGFKKEEIWQVYRYCSYEYLKHDYISKSQFYKKTWFYMKKRFWRHLRELSGTNPDLYSKFCYNFLKYFKDSDGHPPKKITIHRYDWNTRQNFTITRNYDRFPQVWTLNNILYKNGKRYKFNNSNCMSLFAKGYEPSETEPPEREEAFPLLWEKDLNLPVNLLLSSECREVNSFAVKILRDKLPGNIKDFIKTEDIIRIFKKPYPFVCNTFMEILNKSFDINNPDKELIMAVIKTDFSSARNMAREWINKTSELFYSERNWLLKELFNTEFEDNWDFGGELISLFCKKNPESKKDFMDFLISVILKPEKTQGLYDHIIKILNSLFSEELKCVPPEIIFNMVNCQSRSVQELGGELLSSCRIDGTSLDNKIIITFTNNEVFSIREAGRGFIKSSPERWKEDLSLLGLILESKWEDTRKFIFEFIKDNFTLEDLTPHIFLDFCDSPYKDLQDFAKYMLSRYISEGKTIDFLRLTEHPDRNIHDFALDLVIDNLPCEPEDIKNILPFFKTILFQVNKGRKTKDKLLGYLEKISLKNPFVAAEIMPLLESFAGSMTGKDFSSCLVMMTRIKSLYPYISSPVEILS